MIIKDRIVIARYKTMAERDRVYSRWIKKNGKPPDNFGCICCAELECLNDCQGIKDPRVKKMT